MKEDNILAFIDDFTDKWFLDGYLESLVNCDSVSVLCNRFGDVSSIKISFGKSTRWILLAKTWGDKANVGFLKRLSSFYDWVGVGSQNTPGAMGMAMARRSWRIYDLGFHTSPSSAACEYIYEHQIGGRVDTPGIYRYYPLGIENDQASAYLAENEQLPTSTSIRFEKYPSDRYFTWFGECKVTIKKRLALGPFPVRLESGLVSYPIEPGRYTCYIWKEQYEQILLSGCDVEPNGGYGWLECTLDQVELCKEMYKLKVTAPEGYMQDYMKKVIVAYLGRYGMKGDFHTVVPEGKQSPTDDRIITTDGIPTMFFIHPEPNKRATPMPHWYNYLLQMVAWETYKFALPYAERGELIATNYDSCLVSSLLPDSRSVRKYSAEDIISSVPGSWKWELLHNVYVPYPRGIRSDEKTRTPGLSRSEEGMK